MFEKGVKRILVSGGIAGIAAFLFGSILWMNPFVSSVYAKYGQWPGAKPVAEFGNLMNWMALMLLGSIASWVFMAVVWHYIEKGIPEKVVWERGAMFGTLMWFTVTVPHAWNTWLMYRVPGMILFTDTTLGFINSVLSGIVLASVYAKLGPAKTAKASRPSRSRSKGRR